MQISANVTKNDSSERYESEKKTVRCKRCGTRMKVSYMLEHCPCGSTDLHFEADRTTDANGEKIDRWADFCNIFIHYRQEEGYSPQDARRKAILEMIAFGFIKDEEELKKLREEHLNA
ncbi:MAG: hypothetical protein IMZ60_04070 [Actinobacteria bacterium]|nr:hypothetical protein [Actinomycetota bacterium]